MSKTSNSNSTDLFHKFNYIGSKNKLINNIITIIEEKTNSPIKGKTIGDLFSGTAICSYKFRELGAKVISNDLEYYGYIIANCFSKSSYNENIEKIINDLNSLEGVPGLIHKNYSPKGSRMYFTEQNAMKIDAMRLHLEELKKTEKINLEEYYYLLTCILLASDKVANITSVYGAFLKNFKKSALKDIIVDPVHRLTDKNENIVYNEDINKLSIQKNRYDIVYLDPPYNGRQYSKNYHVLNYIAEYSPQEIKGITGLLEKSNISGYCKKAEVKEKLKEILNNLDAQWIFMSYNNEGLLSKEEIVDMMKDYGTVEVEEMLYKKFKSNQNNNEKNVIEYLFCLKKEIKKIK